MEFHSWKRNFRTEVCMRTAEPQVTMLWIKEVEMAKSIDELMKSRSIVGRTYFPDFDMHDAMIALVLKKPINTQSTFRKGVSVEEQHAQKNTTESYSPARTQDGHEKNSQANLG